MSTRSFMRWFGYATGTTPMKWVNQQRLARARQLLVETDLPIERIARETGFGSSGRLRQRFAHSLQTTPAAYRQSFAQGRDRASKAGALG